VPQKITRGGGGDTAPGRHKGIDIRKKKKVKTSGRDRIKGSSDRVSPSRLKPCPPWGEEEWGKTIREQTGGVSQYRGDGRKRSLERKSERKILALQRNEKETVVGTISKGKKET